LYVVSGSAESISGIAGIANSTTFYVYYDVSGGVFLASTTAPTFDKEKRGWYNGNDRALFRIYKDSGGEYDERTQLSIGNIRKFVRTFTSSGSFVVPSGTRQIKIIACGGGGGGGGRSGGTGVTGGATTVSSSSSGIDVRTDTATGGQATGFPGGFISSIAIAFPYDWDAVHIGGSGQMGISTTAGGSGGSGGMSLFGGGNSNNRVPGTSFGGDDAAAWGAGGAGAQDATTGGGGGRAGSTVEYLAKNVVEGETLTITIGSGGAGGSSTYDGGDGADGVCIIEFE
jgi:hypothetical protein